jgi:hypothetical protein
MNSMRETKRQRKRRYLASRSALSQRNIVEHAISECKRVVHRNKSMRTNALRTSQTLLAKVAYVPPNDKKD